MIIEELDISFQENVHLFLKDIRGIHRALFGKLFFWPALN
jgi:hypothetical protein